MANNQVRIIGGQWRSRRLTFPPIPGLRPTPDRVKETLFNWLAPHIHGIRCLDAFAGSGALGFEALSRGAAHTVFLESSRDVAQALRDNAALLKTSDATVHCVDTLSWLAQPATDTFDLVLLDPPYALSLLEPCITLLLQHGWLNPGAFIYAESNAPIPDFPGLTQHRTQKASQVYGVLFHVPVDEHPISNHC